MAEVYLSNQIKKSQNLEISIDSKPEKIVKGEIDAINLIGKGLVIKNITIEEVKLKLDDLALNLIEIISGKFKLERPGKLNTKITLNSADCDRLLNSKYLNTLLKRLPVEINQSLFTFEIQHVRCNLKERARLTLIAELVLINGQQQDYVSAEGRELLPSSIESKKRSSKSIY